MPLNSRHLSCFGDDNEYAACLRGDAVIARYPTIKKYRTLGAIRGRKSPRKVAAGVGSLYQTVLGIFKARVVNGGRTGRRSGGLRRSRYISHIPIQREFETLRHRVCGRIAKQATGFIHVRKRVAYITNSEFAVSGLLLR